MSKERRDVLENMRKIDECSMEKFRTTNKSETTIAIVGDRWWSQKAKQEGDKIRKQNVFMPYIEKQRGERPNVGGLSIRSRNGLS